MEVAAEAAAKSTTFVLWYGTIINNLNNLPKMIIQLDCAHLFWILQCQKKNFYRLQLEKIKLPKLADTFCFLTITLYLSMHLSFDIL